MTELQMDPQVHNFTTSTHKLLIDGEWVESSDGQTFTTPNPSTGAELSRVARANEQDVEKAVRAARRAFEDDAPWRRMTPSERGRVIWKIGDIIEERLEEFAELEALDNGKSISVARVADVPLAADMFRYMAGWATKLHGNTIAPSVPYAPGAEFHAYTHREPIGVCAQIIPWNFPLLMAAWKLAPALATGVTTILKPAEQTPLSALLLGEAMQDAGVPEGVVNILTGFGDVGAALAAHDGVDKVAFTGSTEVGKSIVQAASGNLKKVSLELGGKSPNVVYADSDIEFAAKGAAHAIFFNHGQCCAAGSRLFVESSVFDDLMQGVKDEAEAIKVGPGMDPSTQMGPLVSQEQFDRVTGFLEQGNAQGAKTVTGGGRVGDQGYFVSPTVLTDTTPDMTVVREEIFGPVVVAEPFSDVDELVKVANDTNFGLASGVWTRDISKAHRTAKKIKAGTVWVNCFNVFDASLPFGGYKQSGWGREMGEEVLKNYLEHKTVTVQI